PLRAVVPTQVPPPSLTNPSRRFGRWNHSASPKSGGLTTPKTPVRSAHHQLPGAEQQLSRTQLGSARCIRALLTILFDDFLRRPSLPSSAGYLWQPFTDICILPSCHLSSRMAGGAES